MWEVTAQGHSVLSDEVQRLLQPQIQLVKNPPASAADARDAGSIPGSGKSPGVGSGNPPVFLPGKFHEQRKLAGYSQWGHKESDTTE